jgi:hypothetical protein
MVLSRSSSKCSFANSKGCKNHEEDVMHQILSRQYVPASLRSRELIKASFPYRTIGTLTYIDAEKKQFGVLVKQEKIDPEALIRSIHKYYSTETEDEKAKTGYDCQTCKFVPKSAVLIGGVYAMLDVSLNKIVRVQVVGIDRDSSPYKLQVHVLDYGMVTDAYQTQLIFLEKHFTEEDYQSAFALTCQLPDTRLLDNAPFPKLENFNIDDHVEVYVLSDEEPCLAVFGSLVTGPNTIPRELFAYGASPHSVDFLNRVIRGIIPAETDPSKGWASNKWMHSGTWTLVTVLSSEDLGNIAVRDVFASLRYLRLQQSINRCYKKAGFVEEMKVDPSNICSGTPVIVYYMPLNSYIRGTVTNVHHNGNGCDVEALDVPNLIISDVPISMIFHPSSVLLGVPPLVFYFNLMKGYDSINRTSCFDEVNGRLGPDSVAILKLSNDHKGAQLESEKNGSINSVIDSYISNLPDEVEEEPASNEEPTSLSASRAGSFFNDGEPVADEERLIADGINF